MLHRHLVLEPSALYCSGQDREMHGTRLLNKLKQLEGTLSEYLLFFYLFKARPAKMVFKLPQDTFTPVIKSDHACIIGRLCSNKSVR